MLLNLFNIYLITVVISLVSVFLAIIKHRAYKVKGFHHEFARAIAVSGVPLLNLVFIYFLLEGIFND